MKIQQTPRHAGPTPSKRDFWGEKWENKQSSVERLALRVARDIGNQFHWIESPSVSNSDTSSQPKVHAHESAQLRQAVRHRDMANECVKNLTTEVVRLARELRAQNDIPVSSKSTRQGIATTESRRQIVSRQQIQQAMRRRKHIRMWSVLRAWSDATCWSTRSYFISDSLARRYQKRFSRSVFRAWSNRVTQKGRSEHVVGAENATEPPIHSIHLQSAAKTTERISEDSSYEVRGDQMRWSIHRPSPRDDGVAEQKYDSHQGQEIARSKGYKSSIQRYLQHVAVKQMRARWMHRFIHTGFQNLQAQCMNVRKLRRVLKRSFLTISARYISKMLKHCFQAFHNLKLRSLRESKAVAIDRARNPKVLRIILVAWRGCACFVRNCLQIEHGDSHIATEDLASSLQRLKKTLGNLNYDRSSLSQRLNLLLEDSVSGSEPPSQQASGTSPQVQSNWRTPPAGLKRGDVSMSIDQTQPDLDTDVAFRPAGEQKRIEEVYETLESTLRLQAADIQKLERSCVKSAAIEKTIWEELTDVLRSVHDGKTAVEVRRKSIAAAVETRQARQRDTWLAFDELETLLQVAEVKHESETFVDTVLRTPGQSQLHAPLVTPDTSAATEKQGELRLLLHEWQTMADILNQTDGALSVAEFPGISLQLIREHVQDLRTATLSISKKDPGTTEKSLRRLQVNAKLLHIETAQQVQQHRNDTMGSIE